MSAPADRGNHATRLAAAVAFWAAMVLFVTNVSLLSGWLLADVAVAASPPPAPAARPSPVPGAVQVALDGGATVMVPLAPEQSEQIVEVAGVDVTLTLYSATDQDGSTYNVGVIDYPPQVDLSDPAVNLIASVSGAAGNVGGRVVAQELRVYDGAPAADFTIETAGVTLAARNVLDDRRLYALSVAFTGTAQPADAAPFLASLRLGD